MKLDVKVAFSSKAEPLVEIRPGSFSRAIHRKLPGSCLDCLVFLVTRLIGPIAIAQVSNLGMLVITRRVRLVYI